MSEERIHHLYAAAIATKLVEQRDGLMSGLNGGFVALLQRSSSSSDQLWMDLNRMNEVPALTDGSVPLVGWLRAAATRTADLPEGDVFRTALIEALGAPGASPGASAPPRPSARETPRGSAPLVVVWYAPADKSYAELILVHLERFEKTGRLSVWTKDRLLAGTIIADELKAALVSARVVVPLVSADYLALRDFDREVPAALALGKTVLPVLVRPCLLVGTPFEGMTIFPRGNQALMGHPSRDEALVSITKAILTEVNRGSGASAPRDVTPKASARTAPPSGTPAEVEAKYPWHEDAGAKLHELLMNAYDNVRVARHFLATVPIQTNMITDGAAYPFWADALEQAAKEGKLQRLVQRALADGRIATYRAPLERAAAELGLLGEAAR